MLHFKFCEGRNGNKQRINNPVALFTIIYGGESYSIQQKQKIKITAKVMRFYGKIKGKIV